MLAVTDIGRREDVMGGWRQTETCPSVGFEFRGSWLRVVSGYGEAAIMRVGYLTRTRLGGVPSLAIAWWGSFPKNMQRGAVACEKE